MQLRAGSTSSDSAAPEARLRRLAPRHPDDPDHAAAQRPGSAGVRKSNVKAACEACRKRRVKCNGARPRCECCVRLRSECIYPTSTNAETRGQALKRRYTQLDDRLRAYDRVFDFLLTRPPEEADAVYKRIRAGTDVEAIARHVEDGDVLMDSALMPETRFRYEFPFLKEMPAILQQTKNVYLETSIHDLTMQQPHSTKPFDSAYSVPFHTAELIDPELASVNLSRWTTVKADNQTLENLLQVYFLHHYPRYVAFHKDYFCQDLKAGKCQFCSPLLVNAILAAACHAKYSISDRSKLWYPYNLGYLFLAEAQRLWREEALIDRLTTVQAGMVLQVVSSVDGIDETGISYMVQALKMAQNLQLFHAWKQMERPQRDPWLMTALALFNWESVQSYYFLRVPLLVKQPGHLPESTKNDGMYGNLWIRYPLETTCHSMYFGELFKATCGLRCIMNNLTVELLKNPANPTKLSWARTSHYRDRLNAWYARLPKDLSPQLIVLPSHLMLHAEYYSTLVALYSAQVTLLSTPSDDSSAMPAQIAAARDIVADAMIKLETLMRIYYLRHSFRKYDPFLIHFVIVLANFTMERIKEDPTTQTRDSLRSTLILCLKGIWDQGRMIDQGAVVFRVLRDSLDPEDRKELDRYVGLEEVDQKNFQAMAKAIKSRWVVPISKRIDDVEGARLTNLIQKYKSISVDDLPNS